MYLSELHTENFRLFGEGENALRLNLYKGLTAFVGENDSGKTAIIDAVRLAFGTRDQEFLRVRESDFHQPTDGSARRNEIKIRCRFDELSETELGTFVEYLTYEKTDDGRRRSVLYLNWSAKRNVRKLSNRRFTTVEVKSGKDAKGPIFDGLVRAFLGATYLRPLRDAENELSSGRRSRLSQILQYTKEVVDFGDSFDPNGSKPVDYSNLSVLGIADFTDKLLTDHPGVGGARNRLNDDYLKPLSFNNDELSGSVSVSGAEKDDELRIRRLLEKLEIDLRSESSTEPPPARGLGSNNLLFIACELLLLCSDDDGFPLLLIEEPEAHLHPQRQLRLIRFLQNKATEIKEDEIQPQIIVTTHSPNLASIIDLNNIVLVNKGSAFQLRSGFTKLSAADYGFLQRFLDVTKSNLFFARGVLIVEGDAENILLPSIAKLLERDLTSNGVSIVNVGGVGLRRFARIFHRSNPDKDGQIEIPVGCVTDLDVMPDCAPEILKTVKPRRGLASAQG